MYVGNETCGIGNDQRDLITIFAVRFTECLEGGNVVVFSRRRRRRSGLNQLE
jgi:hypothetical protein